MTEATGQVLLVLTLLDAAGPAFTRNRGGWRWAAPAQYAVLAVLAAVTAFTANQPLLAAPAVVLGAGGAVRWWQGARTAPTPRPLASLVGALAVVAATVPFVAAAEPFPGLAALSGALPVAACGVVAAVLGRTADGALTSGRAAVLATLAIPGGPLPGVSALVLAVLLLAVEGRATVARAFGTGRAPLVAGAGAVALLLVFLSGRSAGVPISVPVAGLVAAGACVRLLMPHRRVGRLGAAGTAMAVFGVGVAGLGPPGLAPGCILFGLALHAASVLRLAGARPIPALLAACIALVSVWTVRNVSPGLAVPAGLAAASWAALLLLQRHPARRAAPEAAILHGGLVLCAAGLGTPAAACAGMVQGAGFLLAQAGALLLPRARWPALLALGGLPPSALFISEFLLLREAGRVFWPLLAVLVLAACAFLRRLPRPPSLVPPVAWAPLAASAVLGAASWLALPWLTLPGAPTP